MSGRFEARLAKLEQAGVPGSMLYGWHNVGETTEQALARVCPGGVPPGVEVTLYSWANRPAGSAW